MSSIRLNGVRFTAYSMDHEPRHIHGFYAGIEVIVDLRRDGKVSLAGRGDAIRPGNGSVSAVRRVLTTAARNFDLLVELWEKQHG
jgi:hypothetical protein